MRKIIFYTLFIFVVNAHSQISFGVGVHPEPNYKKMLEKAKATYTLGNSEIKLKVDLWKDKMPTTDKIKDYIQFNISVYANTGTANVKPLKAYFIYLNGKSSNTYSGFVYSYKNGTWVPDETKTKLQMAPAKVVVEFEDEKSNLPAGKVGKTLFLKNEGPFKVEEVH